MRQLTPAEIATQESERALRSSRYSWMGLTFSIVSLLLLIPLNSSSLNLEFGSDAKSIVILCIECLILLLIFGLPGAIAAWIIGVLLSVQDEARQKQIEAIVLTHHEHQQKINTSFTPGEVSKS